MSAVGVAPVAIARPTHLRLEALQSCSATRHVWVPSRRCRRLQLPKGASGHASRAADLQLQQQQLEFPAQAVCSTSSGCSDPSQGGDANSAAATPQGKAATAARMAQQQQRQQSVEQVNVSKAGSSPTVSSSSSSSMSACEAEQPPEIGVAPHVDLEQLASGEQQRRRRRPWLGPSPEAPAASAPLDAAAATVAAGAAAAGSSATADAGLLYPPSERTRIRNSWNSLMRWSRYFRYILVNRMECTFLGAAVVLRQTILWCALPVCCTAWRRVSKLQAASISPLHLDCVGLNPPDRARRLTCCS